MQILFNGVVSGMGIALLAVAFQSVYLPTRVFFIGLAGVYTCTPFIAYSVRSRGGGWVFAVGLSVLASVGLSVLCELASHARLARRQASEGSHLIVSLGIYIILVQAISLIWGNDTKTLSAGSDAATHLGQVVITNAQWITLVVAVLLLMLYVLFLSLSNLGLRLKALADNPVQFALLGYDVSRHRLLAFGVAGLFAAASALVTSYDNGFEPYSGMRAVLVAVVSVIIGGRASFIGPILGAVLLGLLRSQVIWHWSARWQEAVTFGLLALILLLRPRGLMGRKTRLEAAL
jgi:branched-chain amino acid transport system permease protein